jgi:hypothetical protein
MRDKSPSPMTFAAPVFRQVVPIGVPLLPHRSVTCLQINATTFRYAQPRDLFKQGSAPQLLPSKLCDGLGRWSDAILKSSTPAKSPNAPIFKSLLFLSPPSQGQGARGKETRSPSPSRPTRDESPEYLPLHELSGSSMSHAQKSSGGSCILGDVHGEPVGKTPTTKKQLSARPTGRRLSEFPQTSPCCDPHGGMIVAKVLEANEPRVIDLAASSSRPCAFSPAGAASWNAVPFGYDESVRLSLRLA